MNNLVVVEMELNRYFGCKFIEVDYNFMLLEWWEKMKVIFFVYYRLLKIFQQYQYFQFFLREFLIQQEKQLIKKEVDYIV